MDELDACWARLDERLLGAIAAAEHRLGRPEGDPFRGLHLAARDVTSTFGPPAGAPRLGTPPDRPSEPPAALAWLVDGYQLTAFDLDAVLISLAPEFDLRYGRVYAYLQDDLRRRRPSVDLVLDLLCGSAEEKRRDRSGSPRTRRSCTTGSCTWTHRTASRTPRCSPASCGRTRRWSTPCSAPAASTAGSRAGVTCSRW